MVTRNNRSNCMSRSMVWAIEGNQHTTITSHCVQTPLHCGFLIVCFERWIRSIWSIVISNILNPADDHSHYSIPCNHHRNMVWIHNLSYYNRTYDQLIAFSGIDTRNHQIVANRCGNIDLVPFKEHPWGANYIPKFDPVTGTTMIKKKKERKCLYRTPERDPCCYSSCTLRLILIPVHYFYCVWRTCTHSLLYLCISNYVLTRQRRLWMFVILEVCCTTVR